MTRPSDIELLSDIEELDRSNVDSGDASRSMKRYPHLLRATSVGRAASVRAQHDRMAPKPTLPKLKFLEGHD